MTGSGLYLQFDDQNPAFVYGPGWSNLTDANAYNSTLTFTSEKTNVTIQFYGKSLWLFGVIGKTQDWDQPVLSFTLDGRYISTVVAGIKNETSYHQPLAHFHGLNLSSHSLVVENVNEGATFFLDYYLVAPVPPSGPTKPTGNLQTGGEPLSTSISEPPILSATSDSSGNASVGVIIGAVVGGIVAIILIVIAIVVLWKRRKGSKPYYYKSASVYEVLSDEFESDKNEPKQDSEASTPTSQPSYPSSVYSFSGDRSSSFLFSRPTYFPMPSEYQSQGLLAKSGSTRPKLSSNSSFDSPTSPSDDSSSQEQRPLL